MHTPCSVDKLGFNKGAITTTTTPAAVARDELYSMHRSPLDVASTAAQAAAEPHHVIPCYNSMAGCNACHTEPPQS